MVTPGRSRADRFVAMNVRINRLGAALITLSFAAACAGCSGSDRGYSVPTSVCGFPAPESVVGPLLPDGDKVREVPGGSDSGGTTQGCDVLVDQKRALTVTVSKVKKFYDPMSELESFKFTDRAEMTRLGFEGAGAVGDKSSMVSAKCGVDGTPYVNVDVTVNPDVNSDISKRRKDLERFTREYTTGVLKNLGCA
ncbi:hypothetical protein [Streptomyces nodosus]|uniref:hypothetical protein n=1 Tax=Streptomyces nodosus TaxID=40318 RepID=UPI0036E13173